MVDFTAAATADPALDTIVQRIREHMQPELILLYGSRVWGTPREDSDYDVMVVVRDASDSFETGIAITAAIREAGFSADASVISVSDYQRRQHDPGFLSFEIARKGRVLYSTGVVPQFSARPLVIREELQDEGLAMWMERAENDLRTAEMAFVADKPILDATCFHAHACIEKLLKAVIVKGGVFPPRTHELKELLARQPGVIRDDERIARACGVLMSFYDQSRYPQTPMPTPDEAQRAIEAVREAYAILRGYLD